MSTQENNTPPIRSGVGLCDDLLCECTISMNQCCQIITPARLKIRVPLVHTRGGSWRPRYNLYLTEDISFKPVINSERGSLGGEASKELFSVQAASFDDAVTEASASEPSSVGPSVGPISLHTGTQPHSPIVSIRLLSLGRGRPTNEDGAT